MLPIRLLKATFSYYLHYDSDSAHSQAWAWQVRNETMIALETQYEHDETWTFYRRNLRNLHALAEQQICPPRGLGVRYPALN